MKSGDRLHHQEMQIKRKQADYENKVQAGLLKKELKESNGDPDFQILKYLYFLILYFIVLIYCYFNFYLIFLLILLISAVIGIYTLTKSRYKNIQNKEL